MCTKRRQAQNTHAHTSNQIADNQLSDFLFLYIVKVQCDFFGDEFE